MILFKGRKGGFISDLNFEPFKIRSVQGISCHIWNLRGRFVFYLLHIAHIFQRCNGKFELQQPQKTCMFLQSLSLSCSASAYNKYVLPISSI